MEWACEFWTDESHFLQIDLVKSEYDRIQAEIHASRSKIEECDADISTISKSLSRLQQSTTDTSLNKKKIENQASAPLPFSCFSCSL